MSIHALCVIGACLALAGCSTGAAIPRPSGTEAVVAAAESCSPSDFDRHQYITAVSPDGRYFVDQAGQPVLVRGDSPWSGMSDWSSEQAELYFRNREENGFNASIISAVGSVGNGGPDEDGATFDGLEPFVDGDVTKWNEDYWLRIDDYLRLACAHGNTLFLYPIDGWNYNHAFANADVESAYTYGRMIADRYRDFPNLVWMTGGDYFPESESAEEGVGTDLIFRAVLDGIRSSGDTRPFSIQLGYEKSLSTDNPFWEQVVDWNFVYTYLPTYKAVLDGYTRSSGPRDPRPALFGEGNYEGENNQAESQPTTNETLRRQILWAITSGSPGDFRGSDDWEFHPGWEDRLDTDAVRQQKQIHDLFAGMNWWDLVPDVDQPLVVDGRGTRMTSDDFIDVLDNDYVTAARTPDGSLSVVYVPTSRTITLDPDRVPPNATAEWVDPAAVDRPRRPASIAADGSVSTPGPNSDGDEDWLLVIMN